MSSTPSAVALQLTERRPPRLWGVAISLLCVALLALGVISTPRSGAAEGIALRAAAAPAGDEGELSSVADVAAASELWLIDSNSTVAHADYYLTRDVKGHWTRYAPTNVGGAAGSLSVIAASLSGAVFVGGTFPAAKGSIEVYPAIWHLAAGKLVRSSLPPLYAGASDITSISASSPSNVWAAGEISPASNGSIEMLHFNGKAWSLVPYPEENDEATISVSASSPTNAFATDGNEIFRWVSGTWTTVETVPTGLQIDAVATDAPNLAYAVGFNTSTYAPIILKFNGTTWSRAAFIRGVPGVFQIEKVAMVGTSVWAMGNHGSSSYILHSTGGAFSVQAVTPHGDYLQSLDVASAASGAAVGNVDAAPSLTYLEGYNGHTWTPLPSRS
jgi:hypothetical protein